MADKMARGNAWKPIETLPNDNRMVVVTGPGFFSDIVGRACKVHEVLDKFAITASHWNFSRQPQIRR